MSVCLSVCLQVLLDRDTSSYVIRGLRPGSEYEVLLAATYENQEESDEALLLETTGEDTCSRPRLQAADWLISFLSSHLYNHGCYDNHQHRR